MQQVSKQEQIKSAQKKAYTTPSLSRFGGVEQLTQMPAGNSRPVTFPGPQ